MTERTFPESVAKLPPAETEKDVRESVPIAFELPFAKKRVAESVHDEATPIPDVAAGELGDARRDWVHDSVVETGAGRVTFTAAPPVGEAMLHEEGDDGLRVTVSADDDEMLSAPTGTARV